VAKFDQNRLEFSPKKHSVGRIFEEINEDISIRASAQNRELQINIPHNLPEVSADIYGASEILINLIDNAIKYSNEGGLIEVGAQENGDFVEVSVKDYGIGIPNGVLKNLFSKFYRSHRSRETVAGSGIGLYISKAIAENMGGKISVSSKEGKGSTFTVYFPIFDKVNSNSASPDIKNIVIKNHGKML
jgi:signal transduction histidine kinase